MRVCVLYYEDAEEFSPAEFLSHYPCEWEMTILTRPVRKKIKALVDQERFDVFFNLCDASSYEDYPGIDVIQAPIAISTTRRARKCRRQPKPMVSDSPRAAGSRGKTTWID